MTRKLDRPLAVTMGDPAGVGGDILLAAWADRERRPVPPFVAIDDPGRLAALARRLGLEVPLREIDDPCDGLRHFHTALPVVPQRLAVAAVPGRPEAANAAAVIAAIERAVALTLRREAAGIVTLPIHKHVLHASGFAHPGHTEFLAHLAGGGLRPVMMLACDGLRVVPVTIHLPLRQAVDALSAEAIVAAGTVTADALRRFFGKPAPRLAVAALNPHAGEGGDLGGEEAEIIAPAVAALQAAGLDVVGPAPADTLFHAEARDRYDAALCMYHDQALIPLKTIDFHGGVNITLGLPFVRTSPDHGTAFDIAGSGRANPSSLIAALRLAATMALRAGAIDDAA
jgi:4-hydroxythreonine-4-phosphate dehydrogenase